MYWESFGPNECTMAIQNATGASQSLYWAAALVQNIQAERSERLAAMAKSGLGAVHLSPYRMAFRPPL